ncbi:hypothetical protein [Paenibacillus sp. OK003]|uniref:hypothetical protein n=1 Tax=Paenibacillus sp. OK003 TaxID=1884380 RepID=UPI0008AFB49B|nr:hypothetical protein [Paenibacillus sp. OK003]SEL04190.1 hypothetical protein SAMN05518856_10750 [Paenibacillus sp. OK003]
MAITTKRFYRGVLGTSLTTLYAVPSGARSIIKAITVCNYGTTDQTFSLNIAGTWIVSSHLVKARDTIVIPFLDQVVHSGEEIGAFASISSAVNVYISGKEVV